MTRYSVRRRTMFRYLIIMAIGAWSMPAWSGWNPAQDAKATTGSEAAVDKDDLNRKSRDALKQFLEVDPELNVFVTKAYAYAVYPSITKAAIGIGGASGKGIVFVQGKAIGTSRASQFSIGAQLGASSLSEVIFFKDEAALDDFKTGKFVFAATASAVAASAGVAKNSDYNRGVAVFAITQGGLIAEAAIGGMKYSFKPL